MSHTTNLSGRVTKAVTAVAVVSLVAAACATPTKLGTPGTTPVTTTAGSSTPKGSPGSFVDVPLYRMDPSRSGVQPGPGPVGQPQLIWSAKAGASVASPILAGGTLYLTSWDDHLYALDARTGAERWRFDAHVPLVSAPTYNADTVIAIDKSGVVHAVSATSGSELWKSPSTVKAGSTAPVILDGVVYVGGTGAKSYGFDLLTGDERWSWTASTDVSSEGSIAIDGGTIYMSTSDGVLHAIALADSSELWAYRLIGSSVGTPIVAGNIVLINSLQNPGEPAGEASALDRASGKVLWRFRGPSGLQISLGSVRDGVVYAPSQADGVYALSIADGKQLWHIEGPRVFFGTALVGDALYMTSEEPAGFFAIRTTDGAPLWNVAMAGTPHGNAVVSGGMLFGADDSGEVRAYGDAVLADASAGPTSRALTSPTPEPTLRDGFAVAARIDLSTLGIDHPLAMAVGPDGNLYVTDPGPRVNVISPQGKLIQSWGEKGTALGKLDFIYPGSSDSWVGDLAVGPDGLVYVSDTNNHRVEVFKPDGSFVRSFGSFGDGDGQFTIPFDIGVDPKGNVYVTDDGSETLSKFSPTGGFAWRVGGNGESDSDLSGHFHDPDDLPDGRIIAGNDDTGRVIYLNADGKKVESFGGGLPGPAEKVEACDVTVDPGGNQYLGGCGSKTILVLDPTHRPIAESDPTLGWDRPPEFGPNGETYALTTSGVILVLKVSLPTN